jgi:D-beta-D-heptose 7-phosphate kinase/D-beta-D-heptose 1-phosphate adenosyltransferase
MKSFEQLLPDLPRQRVLVIGDVMLDEQIIGIAERISPEAPVPIIEASHNHFVPGGAANVAANLANLGARVCLAGVVGSDQQAEILTRELRNRDIATVFTPDDSRPTTTKTRVIAHGQQIVRIDREKREDISRRVQELLLAELDRQLADTDVVVLSDYLKGVLVEDFTRRVIERSKSAGRSVLVDPKGSSFRKYAGATVITPNTKEAFAALRHHENQPGTVDQAGAMLMEVLPGTAILITRGEEGMTLFEKDARPFHVAATAREVYDVTGAGDTAVAVLALCMAAGQGMQESSKIANYAAGLVVAKFGTATITLDELSGYALHPLMQEAAGRT